MSNGRTFLLYNGRKYDVVHGFDDDGCDIYCDPNISRNVIEVDELIAEQLEKLCNKGYITEFSCSGHPFGNCFCTIVEDADAQKAVIPEGHVAVTQFENVLAVCDLEKCLEGEPYIAFKEAYRFDSLPGGWTYNGKFLKTKIQATSTIGFFRKVLSAVESLDGWISKLPPNRTEH